MALDARLVSKNERPLFVIGVIFSTVTWAALTLGTLGIGLIYALLGIAAVLIVHALFLAHVKGNGVRLSPAQLPELYARTASAAKRFGLHQTPEVYLLQSEGMLNAFATKLLSRNFVIILSSLADACEDPRQLDFVIGHEMGHLAAGHLKWNGFLLPFRLLPWLGAAYSRACEYTCDRCGLETVGELEPATRGLAVLAAGGRYANRIDLTAFSEQRQETGNFWMAVH